MVELQELPVRPTTHAKVRILATADALFYGEGVHTVGVDRIIAEAHVTKATFYKYFRSKDALIVAYVQGRDKQSRDFIESLEKSYDTPERRLRAFVASVSNDLMNSQFQGGAFINAAAQFTDPMHPVRIAVTDHREWFATVLENMFRGMGHPRPGDAADDFTLARDGAVSSAHLGDAIAANAALGRAVQRILDESSR